MRRLNSHEQWLILVIGVFLLVVLAASGCAPADDPGCGRGTSVDIDTDRSKPRTHKPVPLKKVPAPAPRKARR